MAPAATGKKEGSRSRTGAREWDGRTRASGRSLPTPASRSRVAPSEPPSPPETRKAGAGAAKKQPKGSGPASRRRAADGASRTTTNSPGSKKQKMMMAAYEGDESGLRRSKRRSVMRDLEGVAAASASAATEQASDASSALSSPVRRPYFKRAVLHVDEWGEETLESFSNIDPAILDAYEEHNAKYKAKGRNHMKLITLERVPHSCLDNPWFGPSLDSVTEMVLRTAKVVLGLSSYIDGKLLNHATGFIIDWDKDDKMATVLTSALLISTKSPSLDEWLAKDEFATHAEVQAHLLDKNDTIAAAQLIYFHKHYNFALFKIKMDVVSQIPSFSTEVKFGQEIFVLGRDKDQYLLVNRGSVLRKGPNRFERHHNMFISCKLNECSLGGPVMESNGQFLGMVSRPRMKFISSVIIVKCLQMLKQLNCVPRLHTGMKLSAIRFLDPVQREKISRKCSVDAGLIVTEVSDGSIAEKVGIRKGDIVESWDGELVSTTFELENLLLRRCEEHLGNEGNLGSAVEIPVGIYHVRKDCHSTVILTLEVREDVEVVAEGSYDVSTTLPAMVS